MYSSGTTATELANRIVGIFGFDPTLSGVLCFAAIGGLFMVGIPAGLAFLKFGHSAAVREAGYAVFSILLCLAFFTAPAGFVLWIYRVWNLTRNSPEAPA